MKFYKFAKALIYLCLHPRNCGEFGLGSLVAWPRKISGNKDIFIGDSTVISSNSWIEAIQVYGGQSYTPIIRIGNNVQIGRYATITSIDEISIGDGCLFSEYVYISDHAHDVFTKGDMPLVRMPLIKRGKVQIGKQCFLGFRAIIMPGVTLGDRCVVGAGAIVTKSFPSNSVLAGVPAKIIRTI